MSWVVRLVRAVLVEDELHLAWDLRGGEPVRITILTGIGSRPSAFNLRA